eukprot:scaffold7696_cov258-Pinguiococcus_pyrenoidosus.AAC.1
MSRALSAVIVATTALCSSGFRRHSLRPLHIGAARMGPLRALDADIGAEERPLAADPLEGFEDLSGDGGVLRKVLQSAPADADALIDRDIVIVDYEGFEHPGDRCACGLPWAEMPPAR